MCYCLSNFLHSFWSASDSSVLLLYDRLARFLSLFLQSVTLDLLLLLLRGTHTVQNDGGDTGAGQGQKVTTVSTHTCVSVHSSLKTSGLKRFFWNEGQRKIQRSHRQISHLKIYCECYYWNKAKPTPGAQCMLVFRIYFIGGSRLGLHGVYSAC